MINLLKSRNGELTAKLAGSFVHSSYSPVRETEKFYSSNNLNNYTTFILIGPCLNYLSDIIRKKNRNTKIISIYLINKFYQMGIDKSDQSIFFNPYKTFHDNKIDLDLDETDLAGFKVIVWPPAQKFYKEAIAYIENFVSQTVRELHGNVTTLSGFGKKMFKNYFRNFVQIENSLNFSENGVPVIITGSGPGLAKDIFFLKRNRDKYILLALPSSIKFLSANCLEPDLIISTDPGYYAAMHLSDSLEIPLTAPLTANFFNSYSNTSIIPLNSNHYLDKQLIKNLASYFTPSNGTVAGSALLFAYKYFEGHIILSGLDFSYIDCLSHVRPHSFDHLLDSRVYRNTPILDIYFKRNIAESFRLDNLRRNSLALSAYSGWFSKISSYFSNKVFFLDYYTEPPGDFSSISYDELSSSFIAQKSFSVNCRKNKNKYEKKSLLKNLISELLSSFNYTEAEIKNASSNNDIFNLIKSDLSLNLIMPDVLEFKRHFLNAELKESKNRARELIQKIHDFIYSLGTYAE